MKEKLCCLYFLFISWQEAWFVYITEKQASFSLHFKKKKTVNNQSTKTICIHIVLKYMVHKQPYMNLIPPRTHRPSHQIHPMNGHLLTTSQLKSTNLAGSSLGSGSEPFIHNYLSNFPTWDRKTDRQCFRPGRRQARMLGGGGMQVGRWEGLGCMWNREEDGTQVGLR